MRRIILLLACTLLAGCLTTTKAVLNEGNSVAAGDSAAFMAYVEAWEANIANEGSPRELIADGARVLEMDGQILVQEAKDDGGGDYYTLAMIGPRPVTCLAHHDKIEVFAKRHGVTVEIDKQDDADSTTPAPVTADGTEEALHAFVLDVFRHGTLACQSLAIGVE